MRTGELWLRNTAVAALVLGSAACSAPGEQESRSSTETATGPSGSETGASTSAAATSEAQGADWAGILPPRTQLDPPMMTEEACYDDFWLDEEGKRAPLVQEDPPVVLIDGRCNYPVTSEVVGIYSEPTQSSELVLRAKNGDAFGVECWTDQGTEPIQDIRGPITRSSVWLVGAIIDQETGDIVEGMVPEANAGFVDEAAIADKCA